MAIHSFAVVHPDAKIGNNVSIGPFTQIEADVEIGDNTEIASNVVICNGARIGKNCKIFPGAVISAEPQDLKYRGEPTLTIIGDNTNIRECVTINRGTTDKHMTKIGKNCLLMAYVHVAHDCELGDNVIMANLATLAGHIKVEDWAILEGFVAVQQFVTIGAHAFVAGASLVRKDIPPFVKAAREPLCYAGVNVVGLRRRGFNDTQIRAIEDVYRIIYVRGFSMAKAIEVVEKEIADGKEKDYILSFIKKSQHGVIKGMID